MKTNTLKRRLYVVKQAISGITPISEIARNRKINRKTIYRWIEKFKKYGENGLIDKPKGVSEIKINENFEKLVLEIFKENKIGSPKMKFMIKEKGFDVSQRQIQKIYLKHDLKMNKRSRPQQIKFGKYEWPKPNMLWHTDWTECPFTKKQLIAFIDDHSRFVVHAEYFENATTENTLLAFQNAIMKYGQPENILTDQGTQFTPAKTVIGPFTKWCEERGIKHILGRIHHPQTNGKIERWFGTYKQEYDERFHCLDEFVKFYNEKRIHQGINYLRPIEKYQKCGIYAV